MMKTKIAIVLCFGFLLLMSETAEAQRYKKKTDTDQYANEEEPETNDSSKWRNFVRKLTFGGNFGAQFGQVTFVDVSPIVGYRATDKLTVGIGGTYNYIGLRYTDPYGQRFKEDYSLYGGRVFGQYAFYKNIFAHAEYEALNVPDWSAYSGADSRAWISTPLVGGGYRSQIGRRSYFNLTVLYHLNYARNQDIFPMYASPLVIRMGFSL